MLLRKAVLLKSAIDKSLSRLNDIIAIKCPGGKFEDGEDGPTCLRRELFEELGIDAEIGDLITIAKHTTDSGKVIELHTYEITSYTGEIHCASTMTCAGWRSQTCHPIHNCRRIYLCHRHYIPLENIDISEKAV